jgi:hypothetical protein
VDNELRRVISEMMVGNCPKCGSPNTHDCEGSGEFASECEVAKIVDDTCLAHCEVCGATWCLICNKLVRTTSLDRIKHEWYKHVSKCGLDDKRIKLVLFTFDETGSSINCVLCGKRVEDYYVPHTINTILFEAIEKTFKMEFGDIALCEDCIDRFEDELRKALPGKKFEILLGDDPQL